MNKTTCPFRFAAATWLVACWVTVAGCGRPDSKLPAVRVFAAASLRDALQEIADEFERATGTPVVLNVAASGTLANQLAAGAEAEVFISASRQWIDFLQEAPNTAIESTGRVSIIARNRLVVVASTNSQWTLDQIEDLPSLRFRYLCMGDPASVPAGSYAQAALAGVQLETTTVWDAIEPRVARTSDIRRVLALVESDRTLMGIVYATDAAASPEVRVVGRLPTTVDYSAVEMRRTDEPRRAEGGAFMDFLVSPAAKKCFERAGFETGKVPIPPKPLSPVIRTLENPPVSRATTRAVVR